MWLNSNVPDRKENRASKEWLSQAHKQMHLENLDAKRGSKSC